MNTGNSKWIALSSAVVLVTACAEERPPRSTNEFLENPIVLEATIVRCSENRTATRYEAECVNAREAIKLIEAREEAARRAAREAESEAKRQQLRREQEAAAEAQMRAAEAERLKKESEYLAQFGVELPPEGLGETEEDIGNSPMVVIPEAEADVPLSTGPGDVLPATDGGNAPVVTAEPESDDRQPDP